MKYDPEISMHYGFDSCQDSAYRLCCIWFELSSKLFPEYLHTRIPKISGLKKSIIFKIMMKLMKEREFKCLEEYVRFIKAQLLIFKKLQKEGATVLIEPVILVGEGAERRWFIWQKLVQHANAITKMTYTLKDADMEFDIGASADEVKKICEDDLTFENFVSKQSKIRTSIILRKIKPIYVHLSEWVKKLPDDIKNDFLKRADAKAVASCDLEKAKKFYEILCSFEL